MYFEQYIKLEELLKYLEFNESTIEDITKIMLYSGLDLILEEGHDIINKILKDCEIINKNYQTIKLSKEITKNFDEYTEIGVPKEVDQIIKQMKQKFHIKEGIFKTLIVLFYLKKIKADKMKINRRMKMSFTLDIVEELQKIERKEGNEYEENSNDKYVPDSEEMETIIYEDSEEEYIEEDDNDTINESEIEDSSEDEEFSYGNAFDFINVYTKRTN